MDNTNLLRRLALLKSNPKLAETIPQAEILTLLNEVVLAFNALKTAIETNKIKGEKGDRGDDGYTPRPGADYLAKAESQALLAELEGHYNRLSLDIESRLSQIKDGKDAEVTPEMIAEAAEIAASMVELPNFNTLLVSVIEDNADVVVKAVEESGLPQTAIDNLPEDLAALREMIVSVSRGGTIGKNQVYNWIRSAVADGTIPAGGSGGGHIIEDEGTPLTQRDTLNFVGAGVTVTDAGGKTVVTIPGGGGGGGAVDSVNGETGVVVLTTDDISDTAQTNKWATAAEKTKLSHISITQAVDLDAIESSSHAALTVTDSAEIDFTLTGQDLTASLKAGSIDETKLDASVNASLTLANSASQPGHTHTASNVTDFTEAAQDAVGGMVDTSLVYNDATPSLSRAALTGAITASAGSNTTALGSFTVAQLNTAISDADVATGGGTATGSNSGDVTLAGTPNYITIAGQVITRALIDLASHVTGRLPFTNVAQIATDRLLGRDTAGTGDVESLTVGGGIEFTGAGGIQTSAFTGDATKTAGGTALTLATVNSNVGSFGSASQVSTFTVNGKGLVTAAGNTSIAVTSSAVTDFNEAAQDAVGAMAANSTFVNLAYNDATPSLTASLSATGTPSSSTYLRGDNTWATVTGGSNTYINSVYIDQAGGTSDTHGVLGGTRNGSNTVFTVSQGSYATGTLKVWRNGQLLTQGSGEDWTETTPGSGTFTFTVAPTSTDEITVEYQLQTVNSSTLTEIAQDAIGAMIDSSLVYDDATPLLSRAALTGDVTASAGSNTTTIANDAVTYAKIQNVTDNRLLGRAAGSSGDVQELTVSAPLTIGSGTIDFDETAALGNVARTTVRENSGADIGSRRRLNFIEGTNVTMTITDDSVNEEIDITINATGGGGGTNLGLVIATSQGFNMV